MKQKQRTGQGCVGNVYLESKGQTIKMDVIFKTEKTVSQCKKR